MNHQFIILYSFKFISSFRFRDLRRLSVYLMLRSASVTTVSHDILNLIVKIKLDDFLWVKNSYLFNVQHSIIEMNLHPVLGVQLAIQPSGGPRSKRKRAQEDLAAELIVDSCRDPQLGSNNWNAKRDPEEAGDGREFGVSHDRWMSACSREPGILSFVTEFGNTTCNLV